MEEAEDQWNADMEPSPPVKEGSDSDSELDDAPSEFEALGLLQRVQAAGALQGFELKQARAIGSQRLSRQDLRRPLRAQPHHACRYKLCRPKPSS